MTKPTSTRTKTIAPDTIATALGSAVSTGNSWITNADSAAVTTAFRLARLLDVMFDTGENVEKIAPLLGRFTALMHELKLTPLSRDRATGTADEVKDGTAYAENYLRVINAPIVQPKTTGAKSGAARKRPSK